MNPSSFVFETTTNRYQPRILIEKTYLIFYHIYVYHSVLNNVYISHF